MTTPLASTSIPLSLPTTLNFTPKVISGLGKATRRGIKKCLKCGFYNGTRSSMCKNKQCGVFLKHTVEKPKDLEAVKLITGTARQVYSVRVKDTGTNQRGFVQLPFIEDNNVRKQVALCFVDTCQRLFDDSILKCHEEEPSETESNPLCVHINAALKSCVLAVRVDFKKEVLDSLHVSPEFKEKVFLLATETEGPLVQRVSKSVMAVKCQVTPKHPLGYLHFTFYKCKGKEVYEKYYCSCTESLNVQMVQSHNIRYKCIHYYACICALASDSQYLEEFLHFIDTALPTSKTILMNPEAKITTDNHQNISSNLKRKRTPSDIKQNKKKVPDKPSAVKKCKALVPKIFPVEIKVLNPNESDLFPKINANDSWHFMHWLSFVTESINKTMRFENCGIVNSLLFHIPENFYGCFKNRFPNIYNSHQRTVNDSAAFYIMNILHLKEIFDTPLVKLRISKKFIQSEQNNGYVEYDENDEHHVYKSTFIFFLNVGQSTVDESDNTNNSFIIEWIPNVSSLMKIGQLKLQYKYGRKST